MSESVKQDVNASSAEFKEAGLNSTADSKNWQAGIELGQELKGEGENNEPMSEILFKESPTPLFKDSQGNDGSAQDEKDETEE